METVRNYTTNVAEWNKGECHSFFNEEKFLIFMNEDCHQTFDCVWSLILCALWNYLNVRFISQQLNKQASKYISLVVEQTHVRRCKISV